MLALHKHSFILNCNGGNSLLEDSNTSYGHCCATLGGRGGGRGRGRGRIEGRCSVGMRDGSSTAHAHMYTPSQRCIVSFCHPELDIVSIQELADGSIQFSFEAESEVEMELPPLVARGSRLPSSFQKQSPIPDSVRKKRRQIVASEEVSNGNGGVFGKQSENTEEERGRPLLRPRASFVKKSPVSGSQRLMTLQDSDFLETPGSLEMNSSKSVITSFLPMDSPGTSSPPLPCSGSTSEMARPKVLFRRMNPVSCRSTRLASIETCLEMKEEEEDEEKETEEEKKEKKETQEKKEEKKDIGVEMKVNKEEEKGSHLEIKEEEKIEEKEEKQEVKVCVSQVSNIDGMSKVIDTMEEEKEEKEEKEDSVLEMKVEVEEDKEEKKGSGVEMKEEKEEEEEEEEEAANHLEIKEEEKIEGEEEVKALFSRVPNIDGMSKVVDTKEEKEEKDKEGSHLEIEAKEKLEEEEEEAEVKAVVSQEPNVDGMSKVIDMDVEDEEEKEKEEKEKEDKVKEEKEKEGSHLEIEAEEKLEEDEEMEVKALVSKVPSIHVMSKAIDTKEEENEEKQNEGSHLEIDEEEKLGGKEEEQEEKDAKALVSKMPNIHGMSKVIATESEEDHSGIALDLSDYKLSELKSIAKSRGLKGYSRLRKGELIDMLRQVN